MPPSSVLTGSWLCLPRMSQQAMSTADWGQTWTLYQVRAHLDIRVALQLIVHGSVEGLQVGGVQAE